MEIQSRRIDKLGLDDIEGILREQLRLVARTIGGWACIPASAQRQVSGSVPEYVAPDLARISQAKLGKSAVKY